MHGLIQAFQEFVVPEQVVSHPCAADVYFIAYLIYTHVLNCRVTTQCWFRVMRSHVKHFPWHSALPTVSMIFNILCNDMLMHSSGWMRWGGRELWNDCHCSKICKAVANLVAKLKWEHLDAVVSQPWSTFSFSDWWYHTKFSDLCLVVPNKVQWFE